jgi:Na+/H+ antiporter NhaC
MVLFCYGMRIKHAHSSSTLTTVSDLILHKHLVILFILVILNRSSNDKDGTGRVNSFSAYNLNWIIPRTIVLDLYIIVDKVN